MRKTRWLVVLFCLIALSACANSPTAETAWTPVEIASAVMDSQSGLPDLYTRIPADEDFDVYLRQYYQIDPAKAEDGVISYAVGMDASEIAVLRLADESAADAAGEALRAYLERRAGDFAGYAPQQAALVESGLVTVQGRFAALLICADADGARTVFLNCFRAEPPVQGQKIPDRTTPESEESSAQISADAYDPEAVLQAWQTGDGSALSDMNRAIWEAASDVIAQVISDEMSDYEKELSIHDWMTGWSSFDMNVFSHAPDARVEADNRNPYGFFVNRSAMCQGYSSTFQLFMDMLNIECITVCGIPNSNGTEHSWNMVRLDGEWYCVDVAWDDPIGGSPGHTYFNVTSERLRSGSIHRWDDPSVPEATGTAYSYHG